MKKQREHWGTKIGFLFAAAGSAVGIGSVWKFPYTVGSNGGGAFVLLYLIFTFFVGLPVFISELVIGRKSQKSSIFAYSDLSRGSGNWKMLGWINLITCIVIFAYYSVVAGWCLSYILMSLTQFTTGKSPDEIKEVFQTLFTSWDINLLWLFVFVLINAGVVLSGVRKGIEHWSRILMPALFVMLTGLFIYAMFLPGFPAAFHYLFYPNFSKLSPTGILSALGLAFFTLSVGLGIILTYGSYMKPTEDLPKNGLIVTGMTLVISLMAALMIFPIAFTFNFPPESGPGLVFKTMPVLFAKLPGTLLLSTIFFVLLVFAALTSSISLLETTVANLIEVYNFSRRKATAVAASLGFLIGIPCALSGSKVMFPNWEMIYGKDFFSTMDYLTTSWLMPIAGLLTTIFTGWFLNRQLVKEEFEKSSSLKKLFNLWLFCVKFVCPLVVLIIILQESGMININSLSTLFNSQK